MRPDSPFTVGRFDMTQHGRDIAFQRADDAWFPATNGAKKMRWFLVRSESIPVADRYHYGRDGRLVRFASSEAAARKAKQLNDSHTAGLTPVV